MSVLEATRSEPQLQQAQARRLELRESGLDDAAGLTACIDAVAKEGRYLLIDAAPSEAEMRSMIEGGKTTQSVHLVLLDAGQVIGWCEVWRSRFWGMTHSGCLWMGLLPAYRGQGLGKRMIGEALSKAFEIGFDRVELEAFSQNRNAIALYERMGFIEEGKRRAALKRDGRVEDVINYGLMKEEWQFASRNRPYHAGTAGSRG